MRFGKAHNNVFQRGIRFGFILACNILTITATKPEKEWFLSCGLSGSMLSQGSIFSVMDNISVLSGLGYNTVPDTERQLTALRVFGYMD